MAVNFDEYQQIISSLVKLDDDRIHDKKLYSVLKLMIHVNNYRSSDSLRDGLYHLSKVLEYFTIYCSLNDFTLSGLNSKLLARFEADDQYYHEGDLISAGFDLLEVVTDEQIGVTAFVGQLTDICFSVYHAILDCADDMGKDLWGIIEVSQANLLETYGKR